VVGVEDLAPGRRWRGGAGFVAGGGMEEKMKLKSDSKEVRGREAVLDWVARARVAGVDPMAAALGVSQRQIYMHAERLEGDGAVLRPWINDRGGGVLVVTPRGVRLAGYTLSSRTPTRSLGGLQHGRGVSWIASHCERAGRRWSGPGQLRANGWPMKLPPKVGPGARTHMPDLDFTLGRDERWAAEFERMPKNPERLRRILTGYRNALLSGDLGGVLYVCANERIARSVEDRARDVRLDLVVKTLDRIVDEVRKSLTAAR
jgi:DNA-binding transcriptional ArsR family regulator